MDMTTVRALTPADADLAVALVRQFQAASVPRPHLERLLASPTNVLLVAEREGEVIGFLYAHRLDRLRLPAQQLFVYEIEVAAAHRRAGVGTQLMAHVLALAERDGCDVFLLTNRSNEPAVRFYEQLGGREKHGDDVLYAFPAEIRHTGDTP